MTLRRAGALQDGPSQSIIAFTLLLALASAFFTGVIGVHPIFGAFMMGLICPHEDGFAIKVTEKVEDLVGALFLPLYFTLSGLSTNLGLLDTGMTWAYVVGVISVAFCAKFLGMRYCSPSQWSCLARIVQHWRFDVLQGPCGVDRAQYWFASQDIKYKNIHNLRCYGAGYYLRYYNL